MAPGRKRKPGKRYACGKRARAGNRAGRHEHGDRARRRHFGVTAKQAKDERLGTALGRLAFRELISEKQYQAGVAFGELYVRHQAIWGCRHPVRAPSPGC